MPIRTDKLEKYFDAGLLHEAIELITEIQARDANMYEAELSEVRDISFQLQEIPEESVADFNMLYAWVQSYRSRISTILYNIHSDKATWKNYKYRVAQLYRKGKNKILTIREDIVALRNKELQEAAVQEELGMLVDIQELIKYRLEFLDDAMTMIAIKRDEITSADMDLSRQQRVVEILQGIGYPLRGQHVLPRS